MEVHAYLTDAGRRVGLGAMDVACLGIVRQAERDDESLTAGRLGRRLGLSPAATTALLDRMAQGGFIERQRSPRDARVVVVTTTERGRALGRRLFETLNRELAQVLSESAHVPDDQRLLSGLVEATERARDTAADQSESDD